MQFLESMLNGFPKEMFLKKYFSKIPFSQPSTATHLTHLLNWQVIQQVIEERKSTIRIVKNGIVTKDHAKIGFTEAKFFYDKGNTLLLRYAEMSNDGLNKLASDFSNSFHTDVDIQLYCTPEGHNAFGWHYDIEEVFILQTEGSKRYTLRQNTIHPQPLLSSIPKDLQFEKETSSLYLEVLLEPGDWLYIPSGWWHVAETQRASMHISIGLMPRSAMDIISFLESYLPHYKEWRTRFPRHKKISKEEQIDLYKEPLKQLGENLANKFTQREFVESFLDFYNKSN